MISIKNALPNLDRLEQLFEGTLTAIVIYLILIALGSRHSGLLLRFFVRALLILAGHGLIDYVLNLIFTPRLLLAERLVKAETTVARILFGNGRDV